MGNPLSLKILKNKIGAEVPFKVICPAYEKLELGFTDSPYYSDQMGFMVPWLGGEEL
jgi:hypothetical protein